MVGDWRCPDCSRAATRETASCPVCGYVKRGMELAEVSAMIPEDASKPTASEPVEEWHDVWVDDPYIYQAGWWEFCCCHDGQHADENKLDTDYLNAAAARERRLREGLERIRDLNHGPLSNDCEYIAIAALDAGEEEG